MKKWQLYLIITVLVAVLCGAAVNQLDTPQFQWDVVRAEASEDGSSLTAVLDLTTSGNFANMSATAYEYKSDESGNNSKANNVPFIFAGGDTAGDTFNMVGYAYRAGNGPAQRICTLACTLGTQAVVVYPQGGTATSKFYAHKIVVTSSWGSSVVSSDTTGNNNIAEVSLDLRGVKFVKWYAYNADGSGTEAELITVWGSKF